MLHELWNFFTKSVRRQLIWGVVLVHAVLMTLFVWDVTTRQQELLLDQQVTHATALAHSVSTSSAGWLLSHDVTGLQEIIDAQVRYPELIYAMAIDQKGLILAHTDRQRRGQYLLDLPAKQESAILSKTAELVDIISPATVGGEHVGWIRIGIGQLKSKAQLTEITHDGIIYALAAIIIGMVLASFMGTRLTRRLYGIQSVASDIEEGKQTNRRAPDLGTDEAAQLAKQFNKMLDTLEKREQEVAATHEALHKSEARYSRSLRGANDGLWEWNMQTNEVYYSPRWKSMLGYEDDELESAFSTWEYLTYPKDVERTKKLIQQYVDGEINKFESEFRMQHKDGHWLHILSRAELERDAEGSPLLLSGTHVDITERVNAEDRLQQLAENLNEVFWLGSPTWDEIYYISPAYEKIWGQKAEDLYMNPRLWIDSVHPDDREQVIEDIPKDIKSIGEFVNFREYRIQRSDGEIIWIKARAYPIKDPNGQLIRIAGIAEDISERVRMEEAMQRTQKMDALGKLTGGIAHDFNNMLGVILGYSELLEEKLADTPQLSKYIKEISSAGNRAKKLTSKLLAFSREQPADKNLFKINRLLERDHHMLEKTLTAKIDLRIEKGAELWEVCLDEEMLADSILNMCINSMHAMPDGGKLTISTKNIHLNDREVQLFSISAGDYVQLSITDTGTGISPDVKEKIFEPFFTTKGDAGTGLGMSQVYGFVKQSNGDIQVLSEYDKGTQIVIYIPRYEKQKNDKCCITKSNEKSEPKPSNNESILVVDDEPALRKLAKEILQSQNYQVLCAEDGEEALKILTTKNIDLMVTDVIMPNMDGFQLASLVKQQFPEIKILIVSGFNEQYEDENSNDALYHQLDKPYNSAALLNKIKKLLDE